MKNCILTITTLVLILIGTKAVFAQVRFEEKVVFTTDRSSCVSGDTVWFYSYLSTTEKENYSRVIHVQLDGINNRHITKAIIRAKEKKAEGYIVIPDSLSTGPYYLKAFTNQQKGYDQAQVAGQLLIVYNRFEEEIEKLNIPVSSPVLLKNSKPAFGIKLVKTRFNTRKEVPLEFSIPNSISGEIADLMVCVRYIDPLAKSLNAGTLFYETHHRKINRDYTVENNGIIVTGKVADAASSKPVSDATVLLSVSDSIPYFDYYFSDKDGTFRFYLKETKGLADLVVQAVAKNNENFIIELFENYIASSGNQEVENQVLTVPQRKAIENMLKSARFKRYFSPPVLNPKREFIKPPRFKYPFYGKPTATVFTRDYIDLPNFQEISRELLSGSKYREKKDTVILQLLNEDQRIFFNSEPLKLLDGIPIFDVGMLSEKNSENIERIDLVAEKRIFGDMTFDGVIAVYSPNYNLGWVINQPNMFRFDFQTVQIPLNPEVHALESNSETNIPDFRKILLWKRIDDFNVQQKTSFITSDLKGTYEIVVTAVKRNGAVITETAEIIVN